MAFLKKIRAKFGAMTAATPVSLSAIAACSRDDPQPKFFPATITAPFNFPARAGSRSSKIWETQTLWSLVLRYRPAMI